MREDNESRRHPPVSPCTKVCTLDAAGYCIGCLRTGAEIGRWSTMTPTEQWNLITELEARRKGLAGPGATCAVSKSF